MCFSWSCLLHFLQLFTVFFSELFTVYPAIVYCVLHVSLVFIAFNQCFLRFILHLNSVYLWFIVFIADTCTQWISAIDR
jgi:hypothetical protein